MIREIPIPTHALGRDHNGNIIEACSPHRGKCAESQAEQNLIKNADVVANLERAVDEAKHYLLMDTDNFVVRIGDIEIRRKK